MTLKDTPSIVTAAGVAGLEFKDEVATANALVPVLKRAGRQRHRRAHPPGRHARPQLVRPGRQALHGQPDLRLQPATRAGSLAPDSPILPIAKGLDPAIDMIVSGHTHQPYVCNITDPAGQPRW